MKMRGWLVIFAIIIMIVALSDLGSEATIR